MSAKTMKKIEGTDQLTNAIAMAIKAAQDAGLDASEVVAVLATFTTLLEQE